jgi:hypothetical protein
MAKQKKTLTKKQKKQLEYGIVLAILILAFFFWDSFLIYPIKLFVVLTHEISHGLSAILSGGKLDSILITTALGGESRTIGGNKFIIASAGYLGSLLFGVALYISGFNEKPRRIISVTLAILLILFAANYLVGYVGKIASVFFALIFIIFPIYFSPTINSFFFKLLGLISMFYVAIDIKEDILTNVYRPSDAQFIAALTSVSATVWGILWLLISVITIFFIVKWGLKKDF